MASHTESGAHPTSTSYSSTSTSPKLQMADDLAPTLWTAGDAARYLRASLSFVYKVAEAGKLPCLRVGSMLRFDPEVVRAFARGDTKSR